jgi:hypothetical protein
VLGFLPLFAKEQTMILVPALEAGISVAASNGETTTPSGLFISKEQKSSGEEQPVSIHESAAEGIESHFDQKEATIAQVAPLVLVLTSALFLNVSNCCPESLSLCCGRLLIIHTDDLCPICYYHSPAYNS